MEAVLATDSESYSDGQAVQLTVTATDSRGPVADAVVRAQVSNAYGERLFGESTTRPDGTAELLHTVETLRDGVGAYEVEVVVSKTGFEPTQRRTTIEVTGP